MDLIETLQGSAPAHLARCGRPLVTLAYAQSLDGSLTTQRGQSLTLSGPQSLVYTHRLRAAHEAILVGIGTVLADNPRLTVRLVPGRDPQAVVLDSRLRFPLDANLLAARPDPPWIATTRRADPQRKSQLEGAGARLLEMPEETNGRVQLPALLTRLGQLGIRSLMVEGGAQVIASFLRARLVDWVAVTIAPLFVGGLQAAEDLWEQNEEKLPRLSSWDCCRMGEDLLVWGSLAREAS